MFGVSNPIEPGDDNIAFRFIFMLVVDMYCSIAVRLLMHTIEVGGIAGVNKFSVV
jgi:hypothetical protein